MPDPATSTDSPCRPTVLGQIAAAVRLRTRDDGYLDAVEECEVLQAAVGLGADVTSARLAVAAACEEVGAVRESALTRAAEAFVRQDGGVTRADFEMGCAAVTRLARGTLSGRDVVRLMVRAVEESGARVRTGWWWRDWYRRARAAAGLA